MRFKVTLRNKFTAEIETVGIEADNETDARYEADETPNCQVISVRPSHSIGDQPEKQTKSTYVPIRCLRNRVERDLCNKQLRVGKYSPEVIAAAQAREQEQFRKDLKSELGE